MQMESLGLRLVYVDPAVSAVLLEGIFHIQENMVASPQKFSFSLVSRLQWVIFGASTECHLLIIFSSVAQ